MAGVNKVILVGYLGKDPEIRYLDGGVPVANFPLATTEAYKDKSGNIIKLKNKSQYPEFEVSGEGRVIELSQDDAGVFHGKLQPASGQRKLTVGLKYEGKVIQEEELAFDYKIVKEKLTKPQYKFFSQLKEQLDLPLYFLE